MDSPLRNKKVVLVGSCCLMVVILGEVYVFSQHYETRARVFRAHFIFLVQILLSFISKFIWNNLTRMDEPIMEREVVSNQETNQFRRWTVCQRLLLCYLAIVHSSYITNLFLIGREPHWFAMLAYSALGFHFQLATALAILKLLKFGLRLSQARSDNHSDRLSLTANKLSKRGIVILALLYALLASTYGIYKAAQIPEVKRVSVPIRGLSHRWVGARIVQISDIHLGPTVGWTKFSAIVDVINSLRPDIVVMTGDLVDGSVKLLEEAASPMARIRSNYGNFFITGNHEYYTGDVDNWLVKLRHDLGFTALHNSNIKLIPRGGDEDDEICLAGTDDLEANLMGYTGHGFDIDRALDSCDGRNPVIVLAHQPRAAKAILNSHHRVDLVLAGHTHGGQFFPVLVGAFIINPFFKGLYQHGQGYVYVSPGTQYWGVPLRLGSSMEITEITLQSAQAYN